MKHDINLKFEILTLMISFSYLGFKIIEKQRTPEIKIYRFV